MKDIKGTFLVLLIMVAIVLSVGLVYYKIAYGDATCAFRECPVVRGKNVNK